MYLALWLRGIKFIHCHIKDVHSLNTRHHQIMPQEENPLIST